MECEIIGFDTECGEDNGSATVSQEGGNGIITYAWSNGVNTAGNNELPAGTFTVTVTDELGCSSVCSVTIADSPTPVNVITDAAICPGEVFNFQGQSFNTSGTFEVESVAVSYTHLTLPTNREV